MALCVALMIALGLWQLVDRLPQKEAFIAELRANPARPVIAFPTAPDDRLLFRRAVADCRAPVSIEPRGAGASGFRLIARCRGGLTVQLGTMRDPNGHVAWPGGIVAGYVGHAPDGRSLIGTLFDRRPQAMMLVAGAPPPGLTANAPPDPASVPNNHLSYGVQWFFFAAVASVIYVIAVRRRFAGAA
ncbi:SURF1 family cytochrome oxidase biogenesis protein [uncultured Sphingomonas sp.]|uniref:SURF1 family cytochrome oxidase biogenesis protein n=1 Tax=uncultured Sphingomonas sp. TaxID=158754 RepID=UPI0035C94E53